MGREADQDFARRSGLLQAGGYVHRVTRDQGLTAGRDDLSGADPDADLESLAENGFKDLDAGADRPDRIVFVHLRQAEDRHGRVPTNFSTVPP